ncbi:MAG: hypothetical protein U9M92_02590 [Patescibacteria group bacterium]|nr:hypothetical protein [Patescibacteria group bacterium]
MVTTNNNLDWLDPRKAEFRLGELAALFFQDGIQIVAGWRTAGVAMALTVAKHIACAMQRTDVGFACLESGADGQGYITDTVRALVQGKKILVVTDRLGSGDRLALGLVVDELKASGATGIFVGVLENDDGALPDGAADQVRVKSLVKK